MNHFHFFLFYSNKEKTFFLENLINSIEPSMLQNIALGVLTIFAALVVGFIVNTSQANLNKKQVNENIQYLEREYLGNHLTSKGVVAGAIFASLALPLFYKISSVFGKLFILVLFAILLTYLFFVMNRFYKYYIFDNKGREKIVLDGVLGNRFNLNVWRNLLAIDLKILSWGKEVEVVSKFSKDLKKQTTFDLAKGDITPSKRLLEVFEVNLEKRDLYIVVDNLFKELLDLYQSIQIKNTNTLKTKAEKANNSKRFALRTRIQVFLKKILNLSFSTQYSYIFPLYNEFLISLDEKAPKSSLLEYQNYITANNVLFQGLSRELLDSSTSIDYNFFPDVLSIDSENKNEALFYVFLWTIDSHFKERENYRYIMSRLTSENFNIVIKNQSEINKFIRKQKKRAEDNLKKPE